MSDRTLAIAAIARAQAGVISTGQLQDLGLSTSAIAKRVARGELQRIHRGVYAVGHPTLTDQGRLWAAQLAGGPESTLAYRTAGDVHVIRRTARRRAELIVATKRTDTDLLQFHRSRLDPRDVVVLDGLRVTSVARTLLDLADVIRLDGLIKAVREAEYRRVLDMREIESVLSRANGRRGAGALRQALGIPYAQLESPTEEEFEAFLRARGLPIPIFNAEVLGYRVDAYWPQQRFVVELDGLREHTTRHRFRRDRREGIALSLAGLAHARVTAYDVRHDADWLEATLRGFLGL